VSRSLWSAPSFALDERTASDHGYRATLDVEAFIICDGFSKGDAAGTIDDVDLSRGDPDLKSDGSGPDTKMRNSGSSVGHYFFRGARARVGLAVRGCD
jgi:hypothetical protein